MNENIKIAVRIRPFNNQEKENNSVLCLNMVCNITILLHLLNLIY